MAGRIPEEVIQQVQEKTDILDLIGQYVDLKKTGRNYFGLCPFHSEKSPSFAVHPEKRLFHCYGCGESGNVFTFLMKIEGYDFPEAVRYLAEKVGIDIPREDTTREKPEAVKKKEKMVQAHELAAKLFHHVLLHTDAGKDALHYLEQRKIQPETIQTFGLGYSPDRWDFLATFLEKRGFSLTFLEEAGLLSCNESKGRHYDKFRGRIMFPIQDSQGNTVAFGGRVLGDGTPKYLNSSESPIFSKSRLLFNLHRARSHMRKAREAILFEGYVDVISAWQAGIYNGIASLGTALTDEQAKIISRNVESVIVCYDSDNAGMEAAFKGAKILSDMGCLVKVAQMPGGMDPDEYIRQYGGERFKKDILSTAISMTAFRLQMIKRKYQMNDEGQRIRYIQEALEEIAQLSSAIERDHYLRQLADEFHLSLEALKQDLYKVNKILQKKAKNRDNLSKEWNNSIDNSRQLTVKPLLPAYINAEKFLLCLMMQSVDITDLVQEKIGADFIKEEHAALAAHLYGYYEAGHEPDVANFVSYLQDPALMDQAIKLAMIPIDVQTTSQKEIEDYIHQIISYPIRQKIEALELEKKKLEKLGNSLDAARIGMEILQLQKKLKK